MIPGFFLMKQCELPKTEMHTILNSGKIFIMALFNTFPKYKNYLDEALHTIK